MKYLTILFALVLFSCTPKTNNDAPAVAETETPAETPAENVDPVVVVDTVMIKDSDINENKAVEAAFMAMVDALSKANSDNLESTALTFLSKDYVFKGESRDKSIARLKKQYEVYKMEISDLEIKQLESSCNLAYLIVSFKKAIVERATGDVKVAPREKVGLFIMRKNNAGQWRLLVQKTDDGFAHWFYMPE